MFKDTTIVCDKCNAMITHVTNAPAEGWPKLHNLCSSCFAQVAATSP